MKKPLVSVVCLSYNHVNFVADAIESVLNQTFEDYELILIDDESTDGTQEVLKDFIGRNPHVKCSLIQKNVGNCKAFNLGLAVAEGKYIVDLAADDFMLPDRLKEQVEAMEKLDDSYTMCFTDAIYIDEKSNILKNHYRRDKSGKIREKVPTGDVYTDVLERYFICPPTMMMRRDHLKEMGGYDENLAYEDFDYWIRFARKYKFHFLGKVLTAKRTLSNSHSKKFFEKGFYDMQKSTLEVCKKAYKQNVAKKENEALIKRAKYEMKQCYLTTNYRICLGYARLLKKLKALNSADALIANLAKKKVNVSGVYQTLKKRNS